MKISIAAGAVLLFAPATGFAQHDPHWSYEGANGPAHWGALAPSFASCAKGTRYELMQLHFHTPSEHTIDERHGAMEVHFVHRDSAGKLAVIGVLLREGAENSDLERVVANIPQSIGKAAALPGEGFDPMRLLPPNRDHWSYSGSLTTPPCSEDVTWIVMKDPIELSRAQLDGFVAKLHHNARPVQPIGTRGISVGESPVIRK